ncbi:25162_t:CDS:1, partial [Gigaspora rosea]
QARDCGSFCFGINGKYDLNNDRAPILVLTVKDQAGYGSPIAIGLSNKENQFTIHIAVEAVQKNIPCTRLEYPHSFYYVNLPNSKGFQRIRQCNFNWNPYAMIDKHRPSKAALEPILR